MGRAQTGKVGEGNRVAKVCRGRASSFEDKV